jgi:uncharacterized membrane protein
MVWNYDLIKKIPYLGNLLIKTEEKGRFALQRYRWLAPLQFTGIVLFVMIPFQGTGAVIASIVGRMVGMDPWRVWLAIDIGAIIGCFLIAYFATTIYLALKTHFFLGIGSIAILAIAIIAYALYARRKNGY